MPRSKPASSTVSWSDEPDIKNVRFERVATLAMSRDAWQALGASFVDVEDPIGGVSRVASGRAEGGSESVEFGVLDHDEPTTFLLGQRETVDQLLQALVDAGIGDDLILERLPSSPPVSLDERVLGLERFQRTLEMFLHDYLDPQQEGGEGQLSIFEGIDLVGPGSWREVHEQVYGLDALAEAFRAPDPPMTRRVVTQILPFKVRPVDEDNFARWTISGIDADETPVEASGGAQRRRRSGRRE